MSEPLGKLNKRDLIKTALRHYIGVSTYNYDTGTASGLVWEMFPALRKIYKKDDDLVQSLNNHFKFYNCNPWLSPLITGATLAMEEKNGIQSLEAVQNLKVGLMGPLSGIGDTIIWVMIPTILGAIAGSMGQKGDPTGLFLFLFLWLLMSFTRPYLYIIGYKSGTNLISNLGDSLKSFTDAISILGITVIGSIISTTVKVNVGWQFVRSGVKVNLQDILNKLCPSLLPAIVVLILYLLLKNKKAKMGWLIVGIIIISMAGAAVGLFKA
ncbi:PTS system mannose/fructose/sorbose family transporter subunit IID [Bombilactobacillus bombi]|uniref:PTS system mannose/fructose/sorbose family transporter subunit IID n=1 Tax=Bombilactobacillus bombi TaxID=1303590 RepID=UPI000E56EB0A|nr:PTS system mannose/fructose/sorbose family transporter subunit IID [Bombilactobacillus bombi]AXX65412.1 PTS system mannose/fructose/sorbose family transporter subunit IID [Bombilactobacillus bombi]